jgi:hypothetical protein
MFLKIFDFARNISALPKLYSEGGQ